MTTVDPAPEAALAPPIEPETGGNDLGRRARRGAVWSLVGYAGGRLLGFVSNPLLSYLLLPAVFGLNQLITPFILGFELLSDVGIGPSIIQSKRGNEQRFVDVAWTIQAIRGFLLWIAVCIATWPYARLTEPELVYIMPVAGLVAVFGGLTSTKMYTMSRDLAVGRLTAVELSAQLAGFVVKLVWAYFDRTVWALVIGGLATALVKMVLSHVLLPGKINRPRWDRGVVREIVHFGRWVFVSTLLTFLTGYADRWIFNAMIPLATLGLYGNAIVLASLPMEALSHVAHQVVFPLYARVVQAGEELGPVFRRARLPLQMIGGWALCGLIAGAPPGSGCSTTKTSGARGG
jgi:O-antigen/teichoic acid export membrane protein